MKRITLIIFIALTFIVNTSQAGWFSSSEPDKTQQITKLENQLQEERHTTGNWQIIAFVLGTGCMVLLVIGSAIGSKARRDAKRDSN